MKFKNSFMTGPGLRALIVAHTNEAENANDSRSPAVLNCPPTPGETAEPGKIDKSRGLHKQNKRLETATIIVSCRAALDRSIIGAIDQVLVLLNYPIGLTQARFVKSIHESPAKSRKTTRNMSKNGQQHRARETDAVFIGVCDCLQRHFSLHQDFGFRGIFTRALASIG